MENMTLNEQLSRYLVFLREEERTPATVKQYERDIRQFLTFLGEKELTREQTLAYKAKLEETYQPVSVNAKLAAINGVLVFAGHADLRLKFLKIQQKAYCPAEKELTKNEYRRLVKAAEEGNDSRLSPLLQTLCGMGIRVSELKFITVEAVKKGEVTIHLKGKARLLLIPEKLQCVLQAYVKEKGVETGKIFVTKNGNSLDRSNIWKMLKSLCQKAGVCEKKVFPHNLRHLFARTFYDKEKDLAKLADIMGHSSVNTTRIYTISSGREHRRCMDALGLILGWKGKNKKRAKKKRHPSRTSSK